MKGVVSIVRLAAISFCVWSIVTFTASAQQQTESFDKPIKETVVDMGPSPYYPWINGRHGQLLCYYFQQFMVKQLDMGQKGAEWISIAPNDPAHLTPCNRKHAGEKFRRDSQGEYIAGVKGSFVFLEAADCFDRGCPFAVFDAASGKKLFEDQRRLSPKGKIAEIHFAKSGESLVMRYPRVVAAECSLPQEKSKCWRQILTSSGLTPQPAPKCAEYNGFNQATDSGTDDLRDPSVVSFQVEVTIPGFNVRILPGPVLCWAAD